MAAHIHAHCGHQCQCSNPGHNCCVADIVLQTAQINPNATAQDLQNLVDANYGLTDPTSPAGQLDCA